MPRMTQQEYQAYLARRFERPVISGIAGEQCESELHDAILAECRRRGWIAFHGSMAHRTHRTIGEPDFIILPGRGEVLLIECKSKTGKTKPEQAAMAAMAAHLGYVVWTVRSMEDFGSIIHDIVENT